MKLNSTQIPHLPSLDHLAPLLASYVYLPDPKTFRSFDSNIFPTVRQRKATPRLSLSETGGMFDDNVTPRWALLWAHGIRKAGSLIGWTVAHVWEDADCVGSYTHLGNLALIPEPLAAVTDKTGPLAKYLRFHAWDTFGWKPSGKPVPEEPEDYAAVKANFNYLKGIPDPAKFVENQLRTLENQRVVILKRLMAVKPTR